MKEIYRGCLIYKLESVESEDYRINLSKWLRIIEGSKSKITERTAGKKKKAE